MFKNIKPKIIAISIIALIIAGAVNYVNYLINKPLKILDNPNIPSEFIYNGAKIALAWTDDNTGENLIIQSDKKEYSGFNTVDVYFSITNISNKNQEMDVVIWLEEGKREVERVEKLDGESNSQIPLVILSDSEESQVKSDVRKTTDSAADQRSFGLRPQDDKGESGNDKGESGNDKEGAAQDDLNTDSQNGSTAPVAAGDYGAGDARKDIKGFTNGYAVNDKIESGQTNYYKATIKYPTLSRGEFFIEAFGYSSKEGSIVPDASGLWSRDASDGGLQNGPVILSGAKRSEESRVKSDVRKTTDSAANQRSFGLRPQDDKGESGNDKGGATQDDKGEGGNDIIGYGHLDPWYSSSWTYKRAITLQGSKIATTTSAFPILATTTLADLKTTTNGGKVGNDNGYDIIFVDSDDSTLLNYEREKYASTTGEIAYWIKTDIASSTDKTIYMYYGNAGASDTATTTGVWDSNFVMVNHLAHNGIATTTYPDFNDSTKYANNGSSVNASSSSLVNGWVDGALDFDGTNDYVDLPNGDTYLNVNAGTISFWYKGGGANSGGVFYEYNQGGGDTIQIANNSNVWLQFTHNVDFLGADTLNATVDSLSTAQTSWHFISFSWNVNNDTLYSFYDGTASSSIKTLDTGTFSPENSTIGSNDSGTGNFYKGMLDEFKISNTARTAGWITTEWNNQSSVNTFMTIGAEEWGELDITTAPKVIKTGVESTAFTVQIPHNAVSDVTVNLSSDSSGTYYFASTTAGTAITAVTISQGSSSVNFYYKDYKPGAPTITVAATNFTSDTQQQMVQGVWQNTSYQCRRQITLQGSKIATTTAGFPILATTTLADLKTTANGGKVGNANGYDIIFVDSDDSTLLNYEREKYASTTGEIAYWIKTDIASSTDKTIYMYYGNAGASDTATTTGVWDDNFVMVNHLAHNGIATTTYPDFNDSTKYANNGSSVNMNAADLVNGQVNGALDFDGVDDYVDASNLNYSADYPLSISFWVYPTLNGVVEGLFTYGDSGVTPYMLIHKNSVANEIKIYVNNAYISASIALTLNKFNHIIITRDSAGQGKIYLNTVVVGNITQSGTSAQNARFWIGRSEFATNKYFNGLIDEVRISNTARTAGWITTEWNNQSSVNTFMTIGAEECISVPATRSGGENVKTKIKGGVRFKGGSRF
ncbi:MAG: DUF2341 domain-containing protein [bacterium]|nr:DUF2341 domain-containing protein [bacterium]